MIINKLDNFSGIVEIIIAIFLSIACIYQVGTHTHLNYFFLILIFSFFKKNQLNKYMNGTFPADLLLSIFFLSFSGIDYASFSEFRWRAHVLSPILPAISLFISLVYFYELKRNDFKLSKFSKVQTSFPIIAILLGIVSGITNEINHSVEIFSSLHLLIIILFIFTNFITMRIFFKKEFYLIRTIPISFFLIVILICKSKIYILVSLASIFFSFDKIILKKLLNKASLSKLNKLFNFLKIILTTLFLIILLGGININYIGKIAKPLDLFLTYRLSINSSLFYALNNLDEEKVNPRLIPNTEFKLSQKLKKIVNNPLVKKKRIENLSGFYDIDTINQKILNKSFHNSFIYYTLIHKKIWNYLLYIFLLISSGVFIIKNKLSNNFQFLIYLSTAFLTYIPYLNFILVLFAILICLGLANILETKYL